MTTETIKTQYGVYVIECRPAHQEPLGASAQILLGYAFQDVPEMWSITAIAVDENGKYWDAGILTGTSRADVLAQRDAYEQSYLSRDPMVILSTVSGVVSPAELDYIDACAAALGTR